MDSTDLALLGAVINDEKSKARILALADATEKHDAARKAAIEAQQVSEDTLNDAKQKLLEANALASDAEKRHAELAEWEQRLSDSNAAMTAEKAEFQKVRTNVEQQQNDKAGELATLSDGLDTRHKIIIGRENDLSEREHVALG